MDMSRDQVIYRNILAIHFQTDDMDQKAETIREGVEQIETLKIKIEEMRDKKQIKYKQEIHDDIDGVIDQLAI